MKNELLNENVGNVLLAVCVGVSCLYMMLTANLMSIVTVLQGLATGGAVFCIGYLGKLALLGGEERREKGRKLFGKLLFGFFCCFIVAIVLA